jgi:hypothetical protein
VLVLERYRNHLLFRHVLRGEQQVRWFRFRALPFGLHDSPRALHQVMKPILAALRAGALSASPIRMEQHVDDGIVLGGSGYRCARDTQTVVDTLQKLGFLVSWPKCRLQPSQLRLFSGMLHDTQAMVRRLSVKRLKSVRRTAAQIVSKLLAGRPLSLRLLASGLGRERAARECVTVCYLQTREVLRWQNAALILQMDALGVPPSRRPVFDDETVVRPVATTKRLFASRHWAQLIDWDVDVLTVLPPRWVRERRQLLITEQRWWQRELPAWNGKWLRSAPSLRGALNVETDASGYGGGMVVPELGPKAEARFHWRDQERPRSINWKELAVPELGLKAVEKQFPALKFQLLHGAAHDFQVTPPSPETTCSTLSTTSRAVQRKSPATPRHGRTVLLRMDNTAAVAYVNHQGGSNPALSHLAERLWRYLLKRGWYVHARRLAGVLNVRADVASRWRDDRAEWRLSDEAWHQVEALHGSHSVDLFASRRNTLCERFFSRWLDPDASGNDAFDKDWSTELNPYAHPPYALLPRVLAQVRDQAATITLVAPVWAAQSWFPDLLELSVEPPRLLVCDTLVEPALPTKYAVRQPSWATAVWRISGSSSVAKASVTSLRKALWPDGQSSS